MNNKNFANSFLLILVFIVSFFINTAHFSIHINKIYNIETKENYSAFYWNSYVKNLDKKIRDNWTPPKENKEERIVATVKIAKNGTLILSKIKTSSGNKDVDNLAIETIQKIAPFEPLPPDFNGSSITLDYVFKKYTKKPVDIILSLLLKDDSQKQITKDFPTPENQASKQQDGTWTPYMKNLENKIKQNWHPTKETESKRIVVLFKIGKNGELLSYKIIQTSNNAACDNAVLDAIKLSAPFEPLPEAFKGKSIDIEFTFDYNILSNLDK